ncbi:hypothetical protein F0562_000027 [Nyssa sinensis]|uniref:Uncharacterized protein n=1 Tax=Nyssa sinensis TaxID=561372 RepID=A0A5J5BYS4_9ASTE|nr:hypothetical protein F0562_000027 [Nyssa sinensis]
MMTRPPMRISEPQVQKMRTEALKRSVVVELVKDQTDQKDELFSDAVTEFSDSGRVQGLEEHLEGGRQLDKNVEKIVEGDWGTSQFLKVDATSATMHPPSNTENTSQMHNPEVLERATDELGEYHNNPRYCIKLYH